MPKILVVIFSLVSVNGALAQSTPQLGVGLPGPSSTPYQYGGAYGKVVNSMVYSPSLMFNYQIDQNQTWGIQAEIGAIYGFKGALQAIDASKNANPEAISNRFPQANAGIGEFVILPYVEVGISFQF